MTRAARGNEARERGFRVGPALFGKPVRLVTCRSCAVWFGWQPGEKPKCDQCGRSFAHLVRKRVPLPPADGDTGDRK